MNWLANIVSGRRSKWVVVVIWLLAVVVMMPLGAKLADETKDDTASFLPASAESTRVVETLDAKFPAQETSQGLIVYQRDGGISAADQEKIAADAKALEALPADELPLPEDQPPIQPFKNGKPVDGLVSQDGSLAYTVVILPTDFDHAADWGKLIRETTGSEADGMQIKLTGDIGFNTDADEVFSDIDTKLLLATVLLVLVLLGAIYRSVLVALTPLIVVFFAYTIAQGFIYLLAKSGATVSSNSTSILIVLMFGVGTDYCLLLVSRLREELRRTEDKHDAMTARAQPGRAPRSSRAGSPSPWRCWSCSSPTRATRRPSDRSRRSGSPARCSPASPCCRPLLTIFGRRGFWPRRKTVEYDPEHAADVKVGAWRRFGDKVLHRPGPALAITLARLRRRRARADRVQGRLLDHDLLQEVGRERRGLQAAGGGLPARRALAPMTMLVESDSGPVTEADVEAADSGGERRRRCCLGDADTGQRSTDGTIGIGQRDPRRRPVHQVVARHRPRDPRRGRRLGRTGPPCWSGGGSAIQYDFDQATERDLKVIVPLALLVIAIILAILLRALVAPLVLIASVILSFLCTLGISILFIRFVVGDAGLRRLDPDVRLHLPGRARDRLHDLPDGRVREEARVHGTREGMLRAISATGPGDHQRRGDPRRHLLGADDTAGHLHLRPRFHGRARDHARHLHRPDDHGPGRRRADRRQVWWPSTASGGSELFHDRAEDEPEPVPAAVD